MEHQPLQQEVDDGEPIFAKRQVFKNFHFLIREHSGSYV